MKKTEKIAEYCTKHSLHHGCKYSSCSPCIKKTEKILEWRKGLKNLWLEYKYDSPQSWLQVEVEDFIEKTIHQTLDEALAILTDEIAITHTSKRGKTSGLTSAYMRIKKL